MKSNAYFLVIVWLWGSIFSLNADAAPGFKGVLNDQQLLQKDVVAVWSPLFQASWDKLNASHAGALERIVPPNPLLTKLDEFQWDEASVMPNDGYGVFAGLATAEFAHQTAKAIKKQFGVTMAAESLPTDPAANVVYGFLRRELTFEKQFFRSRSNPLRFKSGSGNIHEISFFGTTGELSDHYGAAVQVLDYADSGKRFVLSIATNRDDERLMIYRPTKVDGETFATAIKHVKGAMEKPLKGRYGHVTDGRLHKNDTVKIPYIDSESRSQFTDQLGGARYYKGDPQSWHIAAAYQEVSFELFEKGARVRVETSLAEFQPFGDVQEDAPQRVSVAPRNFICDQPFFIFIWRDQAALPYFSAKLDGVTGFKPMK